MPFFLRLVGLLALVAAALAVAPIAAQAAGAPMITDSWVASVSSVGVDLRGEVDPNGLETNARFAYIADAAYRANVEAAPPRDPFTGAVVTPVGGKSLGPGSTPVVLAQHVNGLAAGTTYHFRVVASNAEGTVSGPPRAFTVRSAEQGSALLDGRAWEMVSPVDKNGGEVQSPGAVFGGGVWQAAAGGGAVTYSSLSSFAGGLGNPGASQYLSRRGGGGWTTENITTASAAGAFGLQPDGVPFQLFSGGLERGLAFDPQTCDAAPCPRRYLLRQNADGSLTASPAAVGLALAGGTSDLAHVVLAGATNLYGWSGGALTLINLLPGDTEGTPGATLAAPGANSISADGARTYFSLDGDLYLRDGAQTLQVDGAVGGGGTFQVAASDGVTAFFTKGGHLYRHLVGGATTDLTPAGGVEGVLGASPDGAYLYYLTSAGLFLEHANADPVEVAAGADASNYPPSEGTARVAGNGNLVFLSSAPLGEADSGGFSEVYLYVPAGESLSCVSCNPSGSRPLGPSTIPGATANGKFSPRIYKPRALSAAGNRVFFDSEDALVLGDTDNRVDVYEWEAQGVGSCTKAGGCVGLVSDGRSADGGRFLDASADGEDAFFVTTASLVAADPTGGDVYDARVGGGFIETPVPTGCEADACQVIPGAPADPALGTAFFRAEANPPVTFPKKKKHKKKKHHRNRRHHAKKQGRG